MAHGAHGMGLVDADVLLVTVELRGRREDVAAVASVSARGAHPRRDEEDAQPIGKRVEPWRERGAEGGGRRAIDLAPAHDERALVRITRDVRRRDLELE